MLRTEQLKATANAVARRCNTAYSADLYLNWPLVAYKLLKRGFSERQTEAVMRSKWMRWAADYNQSLRPGKVPAKAILDFLDRNDLGPKDTHDLVIQTFGSPE